MLLTLISFTASIVIGLLAWFRMAKSLILIWNHVTPEALRENPGLRFNRFNAIFYKDALDAEGKKARGKLYKNFLIFTGLISLTLILAHVSGLKT